MEKGNGARVSEESKKEDGNGSDETGVETSVEASPAAPIEGAVGLGVDIVEIERMRAILSRSPSFAERVFSEGERAYCDATASPETHYATRFAAKEAVLKALGTGFSRGIRPRDVEVKRASKGRPYVVLRGRAKEVAAELGVRELPISLSYTHTEAVACAMAITEESVRATAERVDPMAELAKQFKSARAMLDDIDAPTKGESDTGGPDAADSGLPLKVPPSEANLRKEMRAND